MFMKDAVLSCNFKFYIKENEVDLLFNIFGMYYNYSGKIFNIIWIKIKIYSLIFYFFWNE